jgi:hypothetical protein
MERQASVMGAEARSARAGAPSGTLATRPMAVLQRSCSGSPWGGMRFQRRGGARQPGKTALPQGSMALSSDLLSRHVAVGPYVMLVS